MKRYLLPTLLLLIFALTGCQKMPMASFTTDKTDYVAGQFVKLTNTSKNAYSYKWIVTTDDTQTTSNSESPEIMLGEPGTHLITLTCFSKNGKVTDRCSQSVNVAITTGDVIFYTDVLDNASTIYIYMYSTGAYIGAITKKYYPVPDCGTNGCLTTTLQQGDYKINAKLQPYGLNKNITITVKPNTCNKVYISF